MLLDITAGCGAGNRRGAAAGGTLQAAQQEGRTSLSQLRPLGGPVARSHSHNRSWMVPSPAEHI